jgi:hypothetical protein
MREVGIQRPSARTLAKMKKGESVQIKGGNDMLIMLNDSRPIKKAFMSGKGMRVVLSDEELVRNMGNGLFDRVRKAFSPVERALNPVVKKVAPIAKQIGRVVKPIAERVGTDLANKALDYAPELGADALSALALATGQPELVPVAQIVGRQGGKELAKIGKKEIKRRTATPAERLKGQPKTVPLREDTQESPADMEDYITSLPVGKLEELLAKARVKQGVPKMDYSGSRSLSQFADPVPQSMYGQGFLRPGRDPRATRRKIKTDAMESGTTIIDQPQALQSQPYGVNWQFQYTLPPDLVRRYRVERRVESGNAPIPARSVFGFLS